MEFNLIKIFQDMGFFARCIAGGLLLMAVASLGVFLERVWALRRSKNASRSFAAIAKELLNAGSFEKLAAAAAETQISHLARLIGAGTRTYLNALRRPGAVPAAELARRAVDRETESASTDLRRGMNVLATVGSIAPFVGLLGTVVGIIDAFHGIAAKGSGGLGAVSGGIAEALVVTAIGLLVAIPAVLAFNYLNAQMDLAVQTLEHARGEFFDHLESLHDGPHHGSRHERPAVVSHDYRKAADVSVA